MTNKAFVTGGTGFIGINLIELLVNEGWQVTALHRPTSNLEYLKRFPVTLAEGALTDRASLARAIPEGTDVVFHVAGDTNFWSKRNAQQDAINIEGTRNLVDASVAKGVSTFIHTSSVSAWGRVEGVITEETPLEGQSSWINYERSKHRGELEALAAVDRGMKVVVLNPGGVAGPYDTNTWGELFFLLRDKALPFASPGIVTISHVHDVVAAHLAAVTRGRNGERYILASDDVEIVDLVGEVARLLGVDGPKTAPPWLLKTFARVAVMLASITGKEPPITPEIATMTSERGTSFRSDKAIRELGYRIRSMPEAVEDNFDWLVEEGLIAPSR